MRRQDLLDLNDALQHPGRKIAVDISTELPNETEVDLASSVEGFLEAVSTGNVLLITGSFTTRIHTECSRCSGPLEADVSFEVDEQFNVEGVPSSLSAQDYARVAADDEPFQLFDGNSLFVEELIRQDLLLAVPTQMLCQYGWDGDCPLALKQGLKPLSPPANPSLLDLASFRSQEDKD